MMAANNPHVIKILRSDDKGAFVLVRVSPSTPSTPSAPSAPSDLSDPSGTAHLKLVATEGVAPYALSLRHDRLDRLRVKNAPCSADDWEHILKRILLDQEPVPGVDATATVEEEQRLIITVRRRVQNITQRLGTLTLAYDENEDIELFEWCAEAVDGWSQVQTRLSQAAAERDKLERAVDDLRQQLEEFLAAKEEDEKAMLAKFCQLLNEKKVKIRIQQRQLAAYTKAAVVEPKVKAEEDDAVQIKEEDTGSSLFMPSSAMPPPTKRGAKRRAEAALAEDENAGSGSDSDDGFEGPATRSATAGPSRRQATPATAEEPASSEAEQTTDHGESTDSDAIDEGDKGKAAQKAEVEAPPPRRNLAFALPRKTPPAATPAGKADTAGSETDSDDEL